MINRVVAFALWPKNFIKEALILGHLECLAGRHGIELHREMVGELQLGILTCGDLEVLLERSGDRLRFCVGELTVPGVACSARSVQRDRFLRVEVGTTEVICTTDYAGSIPVYYANRSGNLVLSNIEPILTLAAVDSPRQLSLENLYGYLRFSHLIWDETLFTDVYSQLPDHTYRFRPGMGAPAVTYNRTVFASDTRAHLSDRRVARELFELNQELVEEALAPYDEVVLPLSSGYDSRMIVAACGKSQNLRKKVRCFTYGAAGTIEVESARRVCARLGIKWQRVELPLKFLGPAYTEEILSIFGSSLHAHGMYQLEFFDTIQPSLMRGEIALTSGFMTGVPAGQHNSKLQIDTLEVDLSRCMDNFSQSQTFTQDILLELPIFRREMSASHERRFRSAFDLFSGRPRQKAIMFDVWTRQRNFIGYYPRTLEWRVPVVSPQMTPEYANFFLSLSDDHLDDRKAVELMFRHHYPEVACIASNSNGYRAINGVGENTFVYLARVLRRLGLNRMVPAAYRNVMLSLDGPALRKTGRSSFYPLPDLPPPESESFSALFPKAYIETLVSKAMAGSEIDYNRLAILQPVAYSLGLVGRDTRNARVSPYQ